MNRVCSRSSPEFSVVVQIEHFLLIIVLRNMSGIPARTDTRNAAASLNATFYDLKKPL